MYSEIQAAGATLTTFDEVTQTNIAYFDAQGADGYTAAGSWITYSDTQAVTAATQWAVSLGLRGVFTFDSRCALCFGAKIMCGLTV